ncbi:hypothetical protein CLV79_105213 [Limimaricola soesokkakensis]|uniref:DUF7282 domain-containing protein n=1 Tax=Limimaricola soesokkakensis TaxID=1343159 RepID=A0A1X6Z968_9RHOB|nr:hypothetical protein [Limimaricola soesokkakensis]PSK86506.1 hypothetical protein CLV79_105213 [Limimaricola soesokkakensis]SLN44851.1 hypothetical protein LOS8367_01959 [Limimaricola soesokkakensis]
MIKAFASAAALSALMAGGALAQDDETMIVVTDDAMMQMSMVDGQTTVTFPLITALQDGYIVVHAVAADGTAGEALGHASVTAGENADVAVTIPEALPAGTQLMAMLHVESNDNGTFDFGPEMTDVDAPVMRDGTPVMVMFAVPEGVADGVVVIEPIPSPDVADPESRSASEDDEERDAVEEDEPAIDPNDTETEGFIEEGEDSEGEGNEEEGELLEEGAGDEETQETDLEQDTGLDTEGQEDESADTDTNVDADANGDADADVDADGEANAQ